MRTFLHLWLGGWRHPKHSRIPALQEQVAGVGVYPEHSGVPALQGQTLQEGETNNRHVTNKQDISGMCEFYEYKMAKRMGIP